jgi:predicted DNA-binding transcriptional regulator YafY
MKIDRIISIILTLLQQDRISSKKLADTYEVSQRTIFRDLETINAAGVPIVTFTGVNGGAEILKEFKIEKGFFNEKDLIHILLGLNSISTISDKELVNTISKIKSFMPKEKTKELERKSSQISVDLKTWTGNKNFYHNLDLIKKAFNEYKLLGFRYIDKTGKISNRIIEPYQLILKNGVWYLKGFCLEKFDFRIFKILRMTSLVIKEEIFKPKNFILEDLSGENWIKKHIFSIKIEIDESILDRVLEKCDEEAIKKLDNGKYIVDFPFVDDDYSYEILLGYGNKCKCLEPQWVKEKYLDKLRNILNKYYFE